MFDELPQENDELAPEAVESASDPSPGGDGYATAKTPQEPRYEPDIFTLLGDVLQQPRQAFAYLSLPRAERMGLAIVIYIVSQIPANWMRNPFGLDVQSESVRILGNAAASVVGLVVATGFLHMFARLLGGRNAYSKLLQAWALASLPALLAAPFLAWDPGLFGGTATVVTSIWSLVLGIVAVREVYGFSTGRALATVFLPAVAAFFLVTLFGVLAAVLGIMMVPGLGGL